MRTPAPSSPRGIAVAWASLTDAAVSYFGDANTGAANVIVSIEVIGR